MRLKRFKVYDLFGNEVTAYRAINEDVIFAYIFPWRTFRPKKPYNVFSYGEGRIVPSEEYYLVFPHEGRYRVLGFSSLTRARLFIDKHYDEEEYVWTDLPSGDDAVYFGHREV